MKKFRLATLLIMGFASLFLLSGCQQPKDLVYKGYRNLKMEKLNFNNAQLGVELVYYNPNNIGLELAGTDFDIYVDNTLLGHSNQNVQVAVPSRKDFVIPLLIHLDMKNLLKNSLNSFFSKEIDVRLKGNVKVGKLGLYKTLPVDFSFKQNFSLFQ